MEKLYAAILFLAAIPFGAHAHENKSNVTVQGAMTCITSNGAPSHEMGKFPNRANPNSFRKQTLRFCFPTHPKMSPTVTRGLMSVGVSVTGVPIRPYTAGYYDPNGRRGISHDPSSGWRQQAMDNPRSLGMDEQNAHVDRSGLYHYHGVSSDLLASQNATLIGYAPDGYEIHYSPVKALSSWALKSGVRPTAPFGPYDGKFEEDFEYIAASGTLDECNGAFVEGTYTYFATDSYPFFPRCFKGVVNPNFMKRH
ncbi:MAG: YHYH protein [Marinosulfonomonas sp.]|nr:YHYH protein [Marinosulfonomonas sp.]